MGAAASSDPQQSTDASIRLDKMHLYLPGDTVSGTLALNSAKYRNRSVTIDLIGEVGYAITSSSGSGAISTTHHHMVFFTVSKPSVRDGENFSLRLDENLPPSVSLVKGSYPYVRYILQVNLSKNNKHRHWIIVCPRVPIPRSIVQPVDFDASNRKQMRLSGSIDRDWVLPGEKLQLAFEINNPDHQHIKHIDGNIFMRAKFTGGVYHEKIMGFIVDNVHDTSESHIVSVVPLDIPSQYLPPTFAHRNDAHPFHVNIEYSLDIEVHVRGVYATLKVTIPLSVGFEPEKIIFEERHMPDRLGRLSSIKPYITRPFMKHGYHRYGQT